MPPAKKSTNKKSTQKKKRAPKKSAPKKTAKKDLKKSLKEAINETKKAEIKKAIKKAKEGNSHKSDHGGGIVWAVFVIFIGVILLLNSTGVVPWGVWNILWRFWPVFLILAGVQIIFGRIKLASLLNGIVAIVAFGLIFLTVIAASNTDLLNRWNVTLPDWWVNISENIAGDTGAEVSETLVVRAEDYVDITKRDVTINLGVGEFTLGSDEIADYLELQASYYEEYGRPILSEEQEDDTLLINFEQEHSKGFFSIPFDGLEYDFTLGKPLLDTDINIEIGAGQGLMELDDLTLGQVQTDIGAGQVQIDIGENLSIADDLVIDIGAGQAIVNLPEDIGFLLIYDVGAGAIKINGNKIGSLGDDDEVYKSLKYDDAEQRITINVHVGAGQFSLNTIKSEIN
ncbi:LiaI-LiaF-like domain-containing protein [Patescibacteria group bacterium]